MTILLIAPANDSHYLHLAKHALSSLTEDWVQIDCHDIPLQSGISVVPGGPITLHTAIDDIDLTHVNAIWARRSYDASVPSDVFTPEVARYISIESNALVASIFSMLPQAFWLSHPDQIFMAERKPYQMAVAQQCGFSVPKTLYTNNPRQAKAFLTDIDHLLVKPIRWGVIGEADPNSDTYTAFSPVKLSKDDFLSKIDHLTSCPITLQAYTEKQYELRVTVVGDKVFACRIDSQAAPQTSIDWRDYSVDIPYSAVTLPDNIARQCVQVTQQLGLAFGCIDLIVTPEGKYVFLEINPNGQWLWIELKTGLPIAQAIAQLLVQHN
jgi:hypothetical protein